MRQPALLLAYLAITLGALQAPTPIAPRLRVRSMPRLAVSDDAYCIVSDELPTFRREDKLFDALLLASYGGGGAEGRRAAGQDCARLLAFLSLIRMKCVPWWSRGPVEVCEKAPEKSLIY